VEASSSASVLDKQLLNVIMFGFAKVLRVIHVCESIVKGNGVHG
jgi:hypothetical protein